MRERGQSMLGTAWRQSKYVPIGIAFSEWSMLSMSARACGADVATPPNADRARAGRRMSGRVHKVRGPKTLDVVWGGHVLVGGTHRGAKAKGW